MARTKIDQAAVDTWLATTSGWECVSGGSLAKSFKFPDFASALAFAVRVGMAAEKRDHHPDIEIGWGKARVVWTTHDASGLTALDLEMATATDSFA